MGDYWTDPKTDWADGNGIGYGDFNRGEANTSAIRDATFRKVQNFGYVTVNNVPGYDGILNFLTGSCYSENGVPISSPTNFTKSLAAWSPGSGVTFGGMASVVIVAAHTWYYAFVIMDPTDGSVEMMFDNNPAGTNISSSTYTEKRFINSFKTGAAGGEGSFDLVEMYSTGDRVFINPSSMYANRFLFRYLNGSPNNRYRTITLNGAEGLATPARPVMADLNVRTDELSAFGFVSRYLSVFTVPPSLSSGGIYTAEFLHFPSSVNATESTDFNIMIDATSQISLGMDGTSPSAYVDAAVRGFADGRLI